ncbi:hypothetical protein [Ramlibacter tataouinensis]|uniref:Signal transduction histidine kinase-like protein n=1 Tax=Ramlibacter tataouinensis (strain ATCC BAA-407 / DSM 14655 / LMG 21543 / TTB310) TaxID=365046 RepID=F5Y3C7_RAMTT|nr:hypothetical protein [Ramlibacter tataouinensis]AEG91214.1 Hypothetical protein Rta_01510 [Ramlibacter tataouinensis TTB310]
MEEASTTSPGSTGQLTLVEAARYALLRRIAFAMRHEMVVHLQPIGMITEVIERRLKAPSPDLVQVQEGMAKINSFSRAAVHSCLDVITWLAPEPGRMVSLEEGVRECISLLRSNFSFRGFALRDELGHAPAPVPRAGLRHVLPASLLLLADSSGAPADITITAELEPARALLVLSLEPTDGPAPTTAEPPYRPLRPQEVEALAQAEGMGFARDGDTIRLTLPRVHETGA